MVAIKWKKRINKEIKEAISEKYFGKQAKHYWDLFNTLIKNNGGGYDIITSNTSYCPGKYYTYNAVIQFSNGNKINLKVVVRAGQKPSVHFN